MYLLHAAIVADRLADMIREADENRLAALSRADAGPGAARRLVGRLAKSVSEASARLAAWSDPTKPQSADAVGYR
jgi:hypothetical protein